eukprot:1161921-Pelagomonas_calceolata.AAC.2
MDFKKKKKVELAEAQKVQRLLPPVSLVAGVQQKACAMWPSGPLEIVLLSSLKRCGNLVAHFRLPACAVDPVERGVKFRTKRGRERWVLR